MSAISSRRDAESTFQSTGEKVYAIPCDAKDSRLGASRVPGSPRVRHVKGRASRVSGDVPALVLLHGLRDDSRMWEHQVGHRLEHTRVTCPDILERKNVATSDAVPAGH